ncbi:kinesin-like protein KIN-14B [Eucalyptus grandis]|uniref:kinesin-like protein KIN-14B n=1 Tax=Eucalyptus grandis TaxID=71139 RepID=UPI00192EE669|nr:kinesin-like protein KIN-14B [Eucalyptus grandis]
MPSRTSNDNVGRTLDVVPSPLSAEMSAGSVALVKASSEKVKTTPVGEYLTAALNDFDPDQYDSLAAISDVANKLLMLVCLLNDIHAHLKNNEGCSLSGKRKTF